GQEETATCAATTLSGREALVVGALHECAADPRPRAVRLAGGRLHGYQACFHRRLFGIPVGSLYKGVAVMPLRQGYAVLKGHVVGGVPAPPGEDHYSAHVVDDELDYRIAINVRSTARNFGKDLWFFLDEDFHHPIIPALKELPLG